MQKITLIILIGLLCQPLFAQDLIKLKNGEILKVELVDISDEAITYYPWKVEPKVLQTISVKEVVAYKYGPPIYDKHTWSFALSVGATIAGSSAKIKRLFQEHRFDRTYNSWLFGEITYPQAKNFPDYTIEMEYLQASNRGIGAMFASVNSGVVKGNSSPYGRLSLDYQNISFHPFYALYDRYRVVQFRVGPSFHYSRIRTIDVEKDQHSLSQQYYRLGAHAAGIYTFKKSEGYFLRVIFAYYQPFGKEVFGPYTTTSLPEGGFPEESITAGYAMLGLQFGWQGGGK